MSALRIRGASAPDVPRLAALTGMLGYAAAAAELGPRLERLLASSRDVVLVAEFDGDEVVGWLHGAEQELLESGRRCDILGLVVDPEHRGRGIGRSLVGAVEAWARARGLEQMAVRSNVARTESHPFYQRLGYTRAKTQHAYRKRLSERGTA